MSDKPPSTPPPKPTPKPEPKPKPKPKAKPKPKTVLVKPSRMTVVRTWIARACSVVFMLAGLGALVWLANILEVLPRTEDAYVRANVIGIAAHVSGEIVELNVVDNQPVEVGQILFVVDPRPYEIALAQAEADLAVVDLEIISLEAHVQAARRQVDAADATIQQARADALYAAQYAARIEPLLESRFVTPDQVVKAQTDQQALEAAVVRYEAELDAARAALASAIADEGRVGDVNALRLAAEVQVDNARLFLEYCFVRSPIEGYITNLNISQGEYANEGEQIFAIVDRSIWYVMANFKETYLPFIEIGDTVEIYLMARPLERYKGRIQGVGWALYQANGATVMPGQLPDVSPTLDWVRLAQRFPVRIIIENGPDIPVRMGETAAVIVLPGENELPPAQFPWIRNFFDRLGLNK